MEFNFVKIFAGGKTLLDVGLFVPESLENVLLAFADGEKSMNDIKLGFSNWLPTAAKENCLIIAPAAPEGVLFHKGSEKLIPRMLEVFFTSMKQDPRKMGVTGIGTGSESADKLMFQNADLFIQHTSFKDHSDLTEDQIKSSWSKS